MPALIEILRPHQYLKNGFVWLGVIFAKRWDGATLFDVSIVFLAFCAAASAVYVLNDIVDAEADRQHPLKRHRPIARGALPVATAWRLCVALGVGALVLAAWVSLWALGLVGAYLVLNAAYSWQLKHVAILDVFSISAGFMLRILAGTIAIGIEPSRWLLLTGLMLTLFLGFAKRRAELSLLERADGADRATTRRVLDDYDPAVLDLLLGVTASCTILSYGLYTVSAETFATHATKNLFYTLPFVVYGIFRYIFLLHRCSRGNDVANDLLTDRHLLFTVGGWLALTLWIMA